MAPSDYASLTGIAITLLGIATKYVVNKIADSDKMTAALITASDLKIKALIEERMRQEREWINGSFMRTKQVETMFASIIHRFDHFEKIKP